MADLAQVRQASLTRESQRDDSPLSKSPSNSPSKPPSPDDGSVVSGDGSPKQIRVRASRFVTPDNTGVVVAATQDTTVTKEPSADHSPAKQVPEMTMQQRLDIALWEIQILHAQVDQANLEGEKAALVSHRRLDGYAARCRELERQRDMAVKHHSGESHSAVVHCTLLTWMADISKHLDAYQERMHELERQRDMALKQRSGESHSVVRCTLLTRMADMANQLEVYEEKMRRSGELEHDRDVAVKERSGELLCCSLHLADLDSRHGGSA